MSLSEANNNQRAHCTGEDVISIKDGIPSPTHVYAT